MTPLCRLLSALLLLTCSGCLTRATVREWRSSWSEDQWPSRLRTAVIEGDRLAVELDYGTGLHRLSYELVAGAGDRAPLAGPRRIPDTGRGAAPPCVELDLGAHVVRLVNGHEVYESREPVPAARWPVLVVEERQGRRFRCRVPPVTYHNGMGKPVVGVMFPFALVGDLVTLPIQLPLFVYASVAGPGR